MSQLSKFSFQKVDNWNSLDKNNADVLTPSKTPILLTPESGPDFV